MVTFGFIVRSVCLILSLYYVTRSLQQGGVECIKVMLLVFHEKFLRDYSIVVRVLCNYLCSIGVRLDFVCIFEPRLPWTITRRRDTIL